MMEWWWYNWEWIEFLFILGLYNSLYMWMIHLSHLVLPAAALADTFGWIYTKLLLDVCLTLGFFFCCCLATAQPEDYIGWIDVRGRRRHSALSTAQHSTDGRSSLFLSYMLLPVCYLGFHQHCTGHTQHSRSFYNIQHKSTLIRWCYSLLYSIIQIL